MIVKKAGTILINLETKKIALVYRVKHNDYSFPKGHLEENESLLECAIRETEEETGRKNHLILNKEINILRYTNPKNEDCANYMYIAIDDGQTDKDIALSDKEILKWTSPHDVLNTLTYNSLKEFWLKVKTPLEQLINNDGILNKKILSNLNISPTYLIENETDRKVVEQTLKILKIEYDFHKYFTDGASTSTILLLNNKYLIKQNVKSVLESETEFLKQNTSDLLQKIIYIDPDFKFVIYEFIPGEAMKEVNNVDDTIQKIISTVSNYKTYDKEGFGYFDEQVNSWSEFLESEIEHSSLNIENNHKLSQIPSKEKALESVKILEKYPFTKKLIHGDFGTHNFIKSDETGLLVGIIDPMTVIGDPLYDILFAFASNTQILNTLTLDKICELVDETKEKVVALLLVVLYSRISRCLKYHPEDIDSYLEWWKKLVYKKGVIT